MKLTALLLFYLYAMAGGITTSIVISVTIARLTICHIDRKINLTFQEKNDPGWDSLLTDIKQCYIHEEVNMLIAIPNILHGDRMNCRNPRSH